MIIFYACKSNLLVEAIRNRSWNEIIEICESQSEHSHSAQMAKQWCRIKLTGIVSRGLLHLACLHEDYMLGIGGCNHLILFLLHAYPDAAMERDRLLRTPLHYAAANDANVGERALHELLESYPEATTARDGQGGCHSMSRVITNQF
ncbi:hypothetical protein MHU86_6530 [Fragilaria crotonensis]|nr:hypothetical protein MHU86_6530 [Fragilaria crotonensis]